MKFGSLFVSLFEAIIKALAKRKKVRELVLPLIEAAAMNSSLPDNAARREWVVAYLMNEHAMSDSTARLLTEAGVALWKKLEAKKKAG